MNSKNEVAQVLKVCSIIFFFVSIFLSIFLSNDDIVGGVTFFGIALVSNFFIYAFGEIVQLLNDIKMNTRNDIVISNDNEFSSPRVSPDEINGFFEAQRKVENSRTLTEKDNLFAISTSGIETSRKEPNKELYKTSVSLLNALAKDGYVPAITFLRKLEKLSTYEISDEATEYKTENIEPTQHEEPLDKICCVKQDLIYIQIKDLSPECLCLLENPLNKGKMHLLVVDTSLKLFINDYPIATIDNRLVPVFKRCVYDFDDLLINALPLGTFPCYTITVDGIDIPSFCLAVKSITGENVGC